MFIVGISPDVLAQQLRELEADRIVDRRPTGGIPAPVVYSLTDYGKSVLPLVESVRLSGPATPRAYRPWVAAQIAA